MPEALAKRWPGAAIEPAEIGRLQTLNLVREYSSGIQVRAGGAGEAVAGRGDRAGGQLGRLQTLNLVREYSSGIQVRAGGAGEAVAGRGDRAGGKLGGFKL